jgi:cysteine sulfinate desulfinase/cysteine desulfurase-like protein
MDHASTTPLDGSVLRAMENVYKNHYFNPGGLYKKVLQHQPLFLIVENQLRNYLAQPVSILYLREEGLKVATWQ